MNKRVWGSLVVLALAVTGLIVREVAKPWEREPAYQGKRLTQWLEDYNRAGALAKTEPISRAIQAMGTNSLPFLVAYLKETNSAVKQALIKLAANLRPLTPPALVPHERRVPSLLALQALGSLAAPLCPDLKTLAEDPGYAWGTLPLLAIGSNSLPALQTLCQSTNAWVRRDAVLTMARVQIAPVTAISWSWVTSPLNGKPLLMLSYSVSDTDVREMGKLLAHPDASVRHASAEALSAFAHPPYADAVKSAIPLLRNALHEADPVVRKAAGSTLQLVDPEAAAPVGAK